MANFSFIVASEKSVKNFAKSLRGGNKEYTSISRVIKDVQSVALMDAGYRDVFAALGLPTNGKFTPMDFFGCMQPSQFKTVTVGKGENRKDEQRLGIWGWAQKKDENGQKVFEADGKTPVMEAVLRTVTAWTPNKLFKCIAQAQAIAAQEAK